MRKFVFKIFNILQKDLNDNNDVLEGPVLKMRKISQNQVIKNNDNVRIFDN